MEESGAANPLKISMSDFATATDDENLRELFRQVKSSKRLQILPVFQRLSSKFPELEFVYADIDECPETTQHIRCTSTFHFFRGGERVDEMFGAGEQRLHDRLWLHS